MRTPAHVEEKIVCDECGKKILGSFWYKIFLNDRCDFDTTICAIKYRDTFYRIITHDKYPQIIGNTD